MLIEAIRAEERATWGERIGLKAVSYHINLKRSLKQKCIITLKFHQFYDLRRQFLVDFWCKA
jgi:hypothetical protein